jgi:thioredoxin 1
VVSENVRHFTSGDWSSEVEQSSLPVLVDFWAPWCAPCRAIGPTIEALAAEFAGRVKVGKVNVDEQPELAERFGVSSIPTLIVMSGGRVVEQRVGALPKPALASLLAQHAAASVTAATPSITA